MRKPATWAEMMNEPVESRARIIDNQIADRDAQISLLLTCNRRAFEEIRKLRVGLEQIAALPDVRCDEAPAIARKTLDNVPAVYAAS